MEARRIRGGRSLAAVTVAAVGVLGTASTASARTRIPEKPKLGAVKKALATNVVRAQGGSREIVSLGYDSRSGLELFVVKVGGQVVGDPFG
jgi:hypothetical protein